MSALAKRGIRITVAVLVYGLGAGAAHAQASFTEGDTYLVTADYPGVGLAVVHIEADGTQSLFRQHSVDVPVSVATTYDPTSDRLLVAGFRDGTGIISVFDADGILQTTLDFSTIPGVPLSTPQDIAVTCDGRIYLYQNPKISYIDPDYQTGGVLTTDGTTQFSISANPPLLYDDTTHSLFLATGGPSSVIHQVPLSADGTQANPIVSSSWDGYVGFGENPESITRGPAFDASGNLFPNGTLFIKVDINTNLSDDQSALMFLMDPVTHVFSNFAISDGNDAASTVGSYNSFHGYGLDLDTGFTNAVRTWAYDPLNQQDPSIHASGVSNAGGHHEGAKLVVIGDTVAGTCPPPNAPPTASCDASELVVTADVAVSTTVATGDDADGDDLEVTVSGLPTGATTSPTSGPVPLDVQLDWSPTEDDAADAPYGVCVTFTDPAGASDDCCFDVDVNLPPSCDAGGDVNGILQVDADDADGATVTLDGTATDPDDSLADLTLTWTAPGVTFDDPNSATPTGEFPVGTTTAVLQVADGRGGVGTCSVLVDVRAPETTCPVMCNADPESLWPPNHKLWSVAIAIEPIEDCLDFGDALPGPVLASSNEPDNATSDGDTAGDVHGADGYTSPVDVSSAFQFDPTLGDSGAWLGTIDLRAERAGASDGRQYVIEVVQEDGNGQPIVSTCTVVVPHDRRAR